MERVHERPAGRAARLTDIQDQKLEVMGRLIAGIAHELSSPIQFIGHSAEYLHALGASARMESLAAAQHDEIARAIDDILEGVAQATHILQAMKQLSHPGTGDAHAVDLNEAVEGAILLARASVRRVADLTVEFGEVPPVVCIPSAVRQVIVNLLVNAADAVEDTHDAQQGVRGRVGVRTRRDGDDVVISVSDTGSGIPDAVRERIFEPFFTTKAPGRGTGQGLSIVRTIVAQHAGKIDLATVAGSGTTFAVRLPIRGTSEAGR
jgi:signal transduction histidine kinase